MLSGRRPVVAGGAPTAGAGPSLHAVSGAAILVIVASTVVASARAECEPEATLSTGVTVRRCTEDGRRWSVVRADLAAADVGVRVARTEERGQTASAWMRSIPGAVVAVQGGAFRFPGWDPEGLTIGEGDHWPESADDGRRAVLALDAQGAGLVVPAAQVATPVGWMESAVSGLEVVRGGVAVTNCDGAACERRPRTAVGLTADGRWLVIVVVEGWTAESEGVSDPVLGMLAQQAGAHAAIRVGEGATSALTTAGGVGAIPSSDGALRAAGPFLAVVNLASGAPGTLWGAVIRGSDRSRLPAATVQIESADGTVVARPRLDANAVFQVSLPSRTYVVRASLAGYRDSCRSCDLPRGRDEWCSVELAAGSGTAECLPEARGLDAGAFPLADGGTPGRDAGPDEEDPSISSGCGRCAVGPRADDGRGALASLALALAVVARVSRRRRSA